MIQVPSALSQHHFYSRFPPGLHCPVHRLLSLPRPPALPPPCAAGARPPFLPGCAPQPEPRCALALGSRGSRAAGVGGASVLPRRRAGSGLQGGCRVGLGRVAALARRPHSSRGARHVGCFSGALGLAGDGRGPPAVSGDRPRLRPAGARDYGPLAPQGLKGAPRALPARQGAGSALSAVRLPFGIGASAAVTQGCGRRAPRRAGPGPTLGLPRPPVCSRALNP